MCSTIWIPRPSATPWPDIGHQYCKHTLRRQVTAALLKAAEALDGVHTAAGVIASGDQFIASAEAKKRIVDRFGARVCEMEGAAIAQVCYINSVPFAIVRAVSDCADGSSHMAYEEFLPNAAATAARLIEGFVRIYCFIKTERSAFLLYFFGFGHDYLLTLTDVSVKMK